MAKCCSAKSIGILLVMLLMIGTAEAMVIKNQYKGLQPPQDAKRLEDFQSMPKPQRLALVKKSTESYYVWVGETASSYCLPSGPACYLFDVDGRLVDWTPDSGDASPQMKELCSLAWENTPISLVEAVSQTKKAVKK